MRSTLKSLLVPALIAGVGAGLASACLQQLFLVPMILQAEAVELGNPALVHDGIERALYTTLFDCLGAFGFALLLAAAYAWRAPVSWKHGLVWGVAGYACFSLAPALGLPPELPGVQSAALGARQAWWMATVLATAGGIGCVAFACVRYVRLIGAALIVLPHIIGAPAIHAVSEGSRGLARAFALGSLSVSLVMWVILGVVTAISMNRTAATASLAGPASSAGA
jgi:cobalt transporter subunit CbtA